MGNIAYATVGAAISRPNTLVFRRFRQSEVCNDEGLRAANSRPYGRNPTNSN